MAEDSGGSFKGSICGVPGEVSKANEWRIPYHRVNRKGLQGEEVLAEGMVWG